MKEETKVRVRTEDGKVRRYTLHVARRGKHIVGTIKKDNERAVLKDFDPKEYLENTEKIYSISYTLKGGK